MPDEKIDYEKDYLIIYKKLAANGGLAFSNYRWFPSERMTQEELDAFIVKWNSHINRIDDGLVAVVITDQLVREICVYRKQVEPLEDIIRDVKEGQESLQKAKEYLESALDELRELWG